MGVWQGLQKWPSALALRSLVCLCPRRGTFSAVQKPLTRGRGSCVPSWDPGCNESWMKRAQDRASGLSRGLGLGQEREAAALLLLSRADSEQVPLWGVHERDGGRGQGLSASSTPLPATRAWPLGLESDRCAQPTQLSCSLGPNPGPGSSNPTRTPFRPRLLQPAQSGVARPLQSQPLPQHCQPVGLSELFQDGPGCL